MNSLINISFMFLAIVGTVRIFSIKYLIAFDKIIYILSLYASLYITFQFLDKLTRIADNSYDLKKSIRVMKVEITKLGKKIDDK